MNNCNMKTSNSSLQTVQLSDLDGSPILINDNQTTFTRNCNSNGKSTTATNSTTSHTHYSNNSSHILFKGVLDLNENHHHHHHHYQCMWSYSSTTTTTRVTVFKPQHRQQQQHQPYAKYY